MDLDEAYKIVKEELDKHVVFSTGTGALAERILYKIHTYILEQKKYAESRRLLRVVSYRILSIISEFIIVYAITRSIEFSITIAPICMVVHSALHWLIDKIIR